MSTTINLRDYYPHYTHDEFVEVSDEVAEVLRADERHEMAYQRRTYYNKAHFSLDAEDGIEASSMACQSDNPETVYAMREIRCSLCHALNTLPEIQGRRVDARYLQGMSIQEIATAEGVSDSSVKESIDRGLKAMRKIISNNFQSCPANRP